MDMGIPSLLEAALYFHIVSTDPPKAMAAKNQTARPILQPSREQCSFKEPVWLTGPNRCTLKTTLGPLA